MMHAAFEDAIFAYEASLPDLLNQCCCDDVDVATALSRNMSRLIDISALVVTCPKQALDQWQLLFSSQHLKRVIQTGESCTAPPNWQKIVSRWLASAMEVVSASLTKLSAAETQFVTLESDLQRFLTSYESNVNRAVLVSVLPKITPKMRLQNLVEKLSPQVFSPVRFKRTSEPVATFLGIMRKIGNLHRKSPMPITQESRLMELIRQFQTGIHLKQRVHESNQYWVQLSGHVVVLSVKMAEAIAKLSSHDGLWVMATGTVYLDASWVAAGKNIIIQTQNLIVVGKPTINVSGHDAPPTPDVTSGIDGHHGLPGQSAGHVVITADQAIGLECLTIFSNAGNGGKGNNGKPGIDAVSGTDGSSKRPQMRGGFFNTQYAHVRKGTRGGCATPAGIGGSFGLGGYPGFGGYVSISVQGKDAALLCAKVEAQDGAEGSQGIAGLGGKGKPDGRDGIDWGVRRSGFWSYEEDIRGELKELTDTSWFSWNVPQFELLLTEPQFKALQDQRQEKSTIANTGRRGKVSSVHRMAATRQPGIQVEKMQAVFMAAISASCLCQIETVASQLKQLHEQFQTLKIAMSRITQPVKRTEVTL
ncbi:MAG: hypothetical protein ACD_45C00642G0001, partial [uncultured bacterium]